MTDTLTVQVNKRQALTTAKPSDYKTLLILDCNHLTLDRVTSYSQGTYDGLPTGSTIKNALEAAFSYTIKPAIVRVGRIKGVAHYAPVAFTPAKIFGITVTANDGSTKEVTTTGAATVEDALDELVTGFGSDITGVTFTTTGTGDDAVLDIEASSSDVDFAVTSFTGDYSITATPSEAAADVLEECLDADKRWTIVCSTNHDTQFQLALGQKVLSMKEKLHFTSTQAASAYGVWDGQTDPSSDNINALLTQNQCVYSKSLYHHEADTLYPEIRYVAFFTAFEPGTLNCQHKPIGMTMSQVAGGGRLLNLSELQNLTTSYCSAIVDFGGQATVGGYKGTGNRMSNGIRVSTTYWQNTYAKKIKERTETILSNSPKLGFSTGRNILKGAWSSLLQTQVSTVGGQTKALDAYNPFTITFPDSVSIEDLAAGVFEDVDIICNIDASIDSVSLNLLTTFSAGEA